MVRILGIRCMSEPTAEAVVPPLPRRFLISVPQTSSRQRQEHGLQTWAIHREIADAHAGRRELAKRAERVVRLEHEQVAAQPAGEALVIDRHCVKMRLYDRSSAVIADDSGQGVEREYSAVVH